MNWLESFGEFHGVYSFFATYLVSEERKGVDSRFGFWVLIQKGKKLNVLCIGMDYGLT